MLYPGFSDKEKTLALFVILTFATIFIVGILWATSRKADDHSH
jgi:hypothetical protein